MKKLIAILMVCLIATLPALADTVDLSGMSYSDLILLQKRIEKALFAHEDFEMVAVPAGLYRFGVDIPEGKWEIHAHPNVMVTVIYGKNLSESGTSVQWLNGGELKYLYGENNWTYDEGKQSYWTVNAKYGYYIEFDSTVYFQKPAGLGFTFK
jgi:hypothetical protein